MMANDKMKSFYKKQGLIISPSHFETFGNVPVETVCVGVPVLINENMGCSEVFSQAELEEMIISFDNLELVADRVINLCGKTLDSSKLNTLKNLINCETVSEKIVKILKEFSIKK
jgi:hypothetical protein